MYDDRVTFEVSGEDKYKMTICATKARTTLSTWIRQRLAAVMEKELVDVERGQPDPWPKQSERKIAQSLPWKAMNGVGDCVDCKKRLPVGLYVEAEDGRHCARCWVDGDRDLSQVPNLERP